MPKLFVSFLLLLALACGGSSSHDAPIAGHGPDPAPTPGIISGLFRQPRAAASTLAPRSGMAASSTGTSIAMSTPRIYHSAVKLANGDLMIVGGSSDGAGGHPLASTEVFSASSEGFSSTGSMTNQRLQPAVARLSDGRIVVLGGVANSVDNSNANVIDVYDGSWHTAPCTEIDQRDTFLSPAAAWGLPDGKILYYGGKTFKDQYRDPLIIDTKTTPWTVTVASTNPTHHRVNFAHLILRDGTIMISGGGGGIVIFNPTTLTFTEHPMAVSRARHGMIQHPDGKVQIYGGMVPVNGSPSFNTSVETYDPATGQSVLVGNLRQGRGLMGSNLLQNGETLHGGGPDLDGHATASQVTYNYNTNVSLFTSQMLQPRVYFVSMALNNGRVVYIGGTNGGTVESSAEIFDSYSAIMMNTPSDTMQLGHTMQVELVSGGPVNWTCTTGTGTIDASGLYTAPQPVDLSTGDVDPTFVVITATSQADPANKVRVTIRLTR